MYYYIKHGALYFKRRQELLRVIPWGEGLRIQSTENRKFSDENWALSETVMPSQEPKFSLLDDEAIVTNGKITLKMNPYGKMAFYNQKEDLLLKEYYRSWDYGCENWKDLDQITMIKRAARTYRAVGGEHYKITVCYEANDSERIYGMGQYQHPYLNLKGTSLELMQKNTQVSVPFAFSSLGYGILWNNPSVGKVTFANNITEWQADSTKQMDLWIVAGDSPAEIVEEYTKVSGRAPMMPDYAMGFWQCKLRYQTQEELLGVAREYMKRNIPVKVIVADFFHWPNQGDWEFDKEYWPDPEAMVKELKSYGMELMVSVWPTVDRTSKHYQEMWEKDYFVRSDRGMNITMDCCGLESFIDVTNPEAREYIWKICKENYRDKGVKLFWLDEAEPEYTVADFDLYRYYDGPAASCANEYPVQYARAFYEGLKADGEEYPISLIRCAWAGSQKYGALVWSGDVPSTFTQLKNQYTAGLNMGLAGIPWWTADIGGFHGGNIHDPQFHELLARWFQYGTFLPVMRLHGDRDPHDKKPLGTHGGGMMGTGADNEVWSYTPELYDIMTKYIRLRESLFPYIKEAMQEAHKKGTPVIKPVFYDYPEDKESWECEDEFLFGHKILVAPVLYQGVREREVYLPSGIWENGETKEKIQGGRSIKVDAPLDVIPYFLRCD